MMRRSALARFAGSTVLVLLLTQAGAAALSHVHGLLPGGPEAGLVGGDAAPPEGARSGHDALDCRACRIRGGVEGDSALGVAGWQLPLPQLQPDRSADPSRTLHRVWHPGPGLARAPPVLA